MNNILGDSWKDRVRELMRSSELEKQASLTATNEADVCKAFSDAAQGFIENKLSPLMKDEHRIGFEVVKRNDDNTRMVGIFAFKVDKDLIFAPVFFLNGEIKGPLLYRCTTKTFVPADKDWASYLADTATRKDGKSRSKMYMKDSPPRVQMQRIAFRPTSMGKAASAECKCDGDCKDNNCEVDVKAVVKNTPIVNGEYEVQHSNDTKEGEQPKLSVGETTLKCAASHEDGALHISANGVEDLLSEKEASAICTSEGQSVAVEIQGAEIEIPAESVAAIKQACFTNIPDNATAWANNALEEMDKMTKGAGVLREMLSEPDYGRPMAEAVVKAASLDFKFANMLSACYATPADLFPDTFTKSAAVKAPEPVTTLEMVFDAGELEKSASVDKRYFADGFYVTDKRPQEGLTFVDESYDTKVSSVSEPGVYSILNGAGGFVDDVFVCPVSRNGARSIGSDRDLDYDAPYQADSLVGGSATSRELPSCAIIKDGKMTIRKNVYGVHKVEASKYDKLTDSPNGVGLYFVFRNNVLIGPILIRDIKTADGVKYCKYSTGWSVDEGVWSDSCNTNKLLVVNPDIDSTDISRGTFGTDSKWIKMKHKSSPEGKPCDTEDSCRFYVKALENIGDTTSLEEWVYTSFGASPAILKNVGTTEKKAYVIGNGSMFSDPMPKTVMMVKLARDMNISAEKAYDLLDKADSEGICKFAYIEKEATHLRLVDRPIFDEDFDSEFGMPMQTPKKYALRVEGTQIQEPASAIGDMLNPTSPTGLPNLTVTTTAPEDLRQLADTYGLPNVFEHAAIGTLANTFDALRLLDRYIPKLEDAVDSLGRIKFMIHWCPKDFEKAYGNDDMLNLEAEVDSNFNACGALLLKLIKRSDKDKHADVSLANV